MSTASAVSLASLTMQSLSTKEPVVSVDWLHENLREPDLKDIERIKKISRELLIHTQLDASWYLPDEQRNPVQEYQMLIHLVICYLFAYILPCTIRGWPYSRCIIL